MPELRTGGASEQNPSIASEDQQQKIVDHFEGIDIDELPTNVREAVTKARASITELHTATTSAEHKRIQAENFARQQQSKADKLASVVSKHNLDPDSTPKGDLAYDKHRARVDRIIRDNPGIKPEVAEAHAKLLGAEADEIRKEILAGIAPLASNVNYVNATQLLSAKEMEKAEYFAIPEVSKYVRDNVSSLVQQGNEITAGTVDHLLSMAYGQHIMNGGALVGKQQQQQIPNLSANNMRGGGHTKLPSNNSSNAPDATDPETLSIMGKINGFLKQGLPEKKAK